MVTCWERADHLALVCDVKLCIYHFSMWYLGSGVVLDCIDSWSLPPLLHCTKQYALSSILFITLLENIIVWQRSNFIQFIHISFKDPQPLNFTYIDFNRYLIWCQSFGDDSPYVCSLYFKFCTF